MSDVGEVLKDRGPKYGTFLSDAALCQRLKDVMHSTPRWRKDLWDDQRQALEMIAVKIARILNGDPDYVDSWLDIEGYARLVRNRLEADAAQAEPTPALTSGLPKMLQLSSGPSTPQLEAPQ